MPEKTTDLIRNYIKNAATPEALETLLTYVQKHFEGEEEDEVIHLHSRFSDFRAKYRQNLIEDDTVKNQLNLDILRFCRTLDAKFQEEVEVDVSIPEANQDAEKLAQHLQKMDLKLQMMQRMLERLTDSAMDRFQHTKIWDNLEPEARDHFVAAIALERDDYLEDYSSVVVAYCKALEIELREKIFLPYKKVIENDGRVPDQNTFFRENVGDLKNHFYDFLFEKAELTFTQMLRIFSENIEFRNDIDRDSKHSIVFLDFLYQRFRFKNIQSLSLLLKKLSQLKFHKLAHSFVLTIEETDLFKNMVIDVLSNIQTNRSYQKIQ